MEYDQPNMARVRKAVGLPPAIPTPAPCIIADNPERVAELKRRRAIATYMPYSSPEPQQDEKPKAPEDAARRKQVEKIPRGCKGFEHPNFLH
jgi:hypothetical protein